VTCTWPPNSPPNEQNTYTFPSETSESHGQWLIAMWEWFHYQYPDVQASYEIIGTGGSYTREPVPLLVQGIAQWVDANTPDVPYTSLSLYIDLPPGVGWEEYATTTRDLLSAYSSATSRPLWIDEFGKQVCGASSTTCANTEDDQVSYYHGFLDATAKMDIPRFAWTASNDYPFDTKSDLRYGLFSDYDANDKPVPRPAWYTLQLYYTVSIPVSIDIKPGSYPNAINVRARGKVPVAVLTTGDFDASTLDVSTVQFGPDSAQPVHYAQEDIDADGDGDLILHFKTQETGIACDDTEATITGQTLDGIPIVGVDSIKTVGCNK
jgi:hypothetical protein